MTEDRWQLVPVELTQAMLDATCATEEDDAAMRATWAELLRSAPFPTPAADEVEAVARAIQDAHAPGHPINHVSIYQARAAIAALQAQSAEPVGEAKAIIDELNACYLYGVSEKSDALAKRIIAHLSRPAEPAGEELVARDSLGRSDADLLRLIAKDHQRLAPNAYHSADTLREIADRIERPATPTNPERLVEALNRIIEIDQHQLLMDEPQDGSCAAIARAALSAAPLKEGSE